MRPLPALLAALLVAASLAGCADMARRGDAPPDPGYAPGAQSVSAVRRHELTVTSFDGTPIATVVHEPLMEGAGAADAKWPVVVFLHGWAGTKEQWENADRHPGPDLPDAVPANPNSTLERFAKGGFLAVAYDARGFGASGGMAGVAGGDELRDLEAVIVYVERTFPSTGRTGVTGYSYGSGQSLLALTHVEGVDAVVASAGWVDLYDALVPGDVPKLAWMQVLYGSGATASKARLQPFVHDWYRAALTREGLDRVRADMAERGLRSGAAPAPVLLCFGMQDTLMRQVEESRARVAGAVRTVVRTGGHGTSDCGAERLAWFHYHLAGLDTGVDQWPALQTVDALGGRDVGYARYPDTTPRTLHLRHPDLAAGRSSATFTVEQRYAGSPIGEPAALWDRTGEANAAVPAALRQDPTAIAFATAPAAGPQALLGNVVLALVATEPEFPFQVAASLLVERGRDQILLGRAAAAALSADDLEGNGTLVLRFPWVKAQLQEGDRIFLEVASNEPQEFAPLLADYTVTFTGDSQLQLPYVEE